MDSRTRNRRLQIRREIMRRQPAPVRPPQSLGDTARALVELLNRRADFLPGIVFEDPQWLMVLELFVAAEERRDVSVSTLCFAAGVPATTALRHIRALQANGSLERVSHPRDRRISLLRLSEAARVQVARYLSSISASGLVGDEDEPIRSAH